MILLCQGAGGLWTGLRWVTPGGVDRLLFRSHGPPKGWVGSTGHYQDRGHLRQPV